MRACGNSVADLQVPDTPVEHLVLHKVSPQWFFRPSMRVALIKALRRAATMKVKAEARPLLRFRSQPPHPETRFCNARERDMAYQPVLEQHQRYSCPSYLGPGRRGHCRIMPPAALWRGMLVSGCFWRDMLIITAAS